MTFRTLAAVIAAASALALPGAPARAQSEACKAVLQSFRSLKSYHVVSTMDLDGKPQVSTIDIVMPDSFHVTQPQIEMIVIGKQNWQRMNGSAWKAMPASSEPIDFSSMAQPAKAYGTCTDAGMGLWKGQPAHIIKGSGTAKTANVHTTMYVFADGYVHHADVTEGAKSIMSMDFSEFNNASVHPPH